MNISGNENNNLTNTLLISPGAVYNPEGFAEIQNIWRAISMGNHIESLTHFFNMLNWIKSPSLSGSSKSFQQCLLYKLARHSKTKKSLDYKVYVSMNDLCSFINQPQWFQSPREAWNVSSFRFQVWSASRSIPSQSEMLLFKND